ncbi:hypothetical protein PIB30_003331 [Stylosanthes scabra]|uniref:Leucine-rich repeat-containing N-terminal plant-type domain-containing protein n=1 Tax=Stylosanthes scabra TaxID=79078 RepID=A0ABU6T516_9FABA|nr:hypothetical protein [Stylosanthes scabra]
MAHLNPRLLLFTYSKQVLILFFFVLFYYTTAIAAEEDEDDSAVMCNLLEALSPTPKGWSKNTSFCNWTGITWHDSMNKVTAIQPRGYSLTGILPSNLNSLSDLTLLDLSSNHLTGPLPSLANLVLLTHVNLEYNNFISVPDTAFQGLFNLEFLSLGNNKLLPWTFPTSLILPDDHHLSSTTVPPLDTISLEATNMEGNILISKLGFEGSIHVLSTMTHLVAVQLQNNKFSGPIPNLSNSHYYLTSLRIDNNFLTGVVPPSLANLHNLDYLSLANNMLRGPIPKFVKDSPIQ